MYWLFLVIFVVTIMIPDVVRNGAFGLPEERIEEFLIFVMGMTGFLFFILKEHQLEVQRKEKLREQRRLQQTSKDLVDSYSYIGEVNRKMDMLMQIGSNLSESAVDKREIFDNILEAATFLLKGTAASIIFYNVKTEKIVKEICSDKKCQLIKKGRDFLAMEKNIYIKTAGEFIIFSSKQTTGDIRSYLVVKGFDEFQGQDNNNQEIIKYLTAQALFVYSNLLMNVKK